MSARLCIKLCKVLDLFRTFRPHPKTLIGDVRMNKEAPFDKIRLLYENSPKSNEQLILENTKVSDGHNFKIILAEVRVCSSTLMNYTRAALSKTMTWINTLE